MVRLTIPALGAALALLLSPSRAPAQGLTLDQYRAAETPRDGFVITRPRTIGHLDATGSLHLDYALEPLRGPASAARAVLVDHQMLAQASAALGIFDRFVVSARLPVVLLMSGSAPGDGDPAMRDPGASGAGLGDLALGLRVQLVGGEGDLFALALSTETTIPLAEAISSAQDLAGEAGVSFNPELAAELRFAPVRITANAGARFRQGAGYQALAVRNELVWALAIAFDAVPDLLELGIEGFGASPFDRFATASVSPVEILGGVRVRPLRQLYLGLAAGAGIGEAYGAPSFRGVFTIGYADLDRVESSPTAVEAVEPEAVDTLEATELAPIEAPGEIAGAESEIPAAAPEVRVPPPEAGEYGQLDRDGDRIVDAEDQCVLDGEDYDEIADSDGCPEEDADSDAVADVIDVCATTPGVATEDAATTGCPARAHIDARGAIVITDRVEFATGSDRILASSEAVLEDVLAILTSAEDVARVRIEGHTDDQGSDRQNYRLSRARASSVRRWLEQHGIAPERLSAWGCGEAHPLVAGRGRAARQTNRRVEFFVIEPMSPELTLRERCVESTP